MPDDLAAVKPSKTPRAFDFIRNIEKAMAKARKCMKDAQLQQRKYADAKRRDVE